MRDANVALVVGSEQSRRRLLSGSRIRVAFTAFSVLGLVAMTALIFGMVSHIFSSLTPSTRADLAWKAVHGARELAHTSDVAIVLGDAARFDEPFKEYLSDGDILALVAMDANGTVLRVQGAPPIEATALFHGQPGVLQAQPGWYCAWERASIEGTTVGSIAVVVSTARLEAGTHLERNILRSAGVGALVAFVLALAFVSFYIGPILRVTEAAFMKLEQTTVAALEAARLKSEFLANMSHEIRTPMNGVLGMIELLHGTALNKKQQRYMQTLHASASGLMTVLNDILDFSKIEAGKLALHPAPCKVRDLVEEVGELFAARAQLKHLEIVCHTERSLPRHIQVDRDRLKQILANLVGNALKFTEQGHVALRALAQHRVGCEAIRFEVVDTGIGIPEEAKTRLFGAFSQVDGSLTRRHGGTGLGLAICRQLVSLMGGDISVDSKLGEGSTFSFWIPLVEAHVEDDEEAPSIKARTLIVDDNATNRFVLEELLTTWGIEHVSATGAEEALRFLDSAAVEQRPFGLLITDMQMPEVDGVTLAQRVLERGEGPAPAVLMLTSQSEDVLPEGANLYIDGLMQKPVRAADLATCIGRILNGKPAMKLSSKRKLKQKDGLPAGEERKVLVVEDNTINQEVMIELLRELGYSADIADTGQRALEILEQRSYPLILMDCQMPVMDGYQATAQIRQREASGERVPIIAVTAHALAEERERVLAIGMDDYLSKPVSQPTLSEMLERWWPENKTPSPQHVTVAKAATAALSALDPHVTRSNRVVNLFLDSVPRDISAIQAAITTGDPQAVKHAAHRLKGGCLAVGAPRMASVCSELEANPPDRAELLTRLGEEFAHAKARLEAQLQAVN